MCQSQDMNINISKRCELDEDKGDDKPYSCQVEDVLNGLNAALTLSDSKVSTNRTSLDRLYNSVNARREAVKAEAKDL